MKHDQHAGKERHCSPETALGTQVGLYFCGFLEQLGESPLIATVLNRCMHASLTKKAGMHFRFHIVLSNIVQSGKKGARSEASVIMGLAGRVTDCT